MQQMQFNEHVFSAMNTQMAYHIFGENAYQSGMRCEAEVLRLEQMFSRYIATSDISRINSEAGRSSVIVSPEVVALLERSVEFSLRSRGLFDPTVGPLVDVWKRVGIPPVPEKQEIIKAMALVDCAELSIEKLSRQVRLGLKGQSLDLGGIAKGYASDYCASLLKQQGVSSAFLNFGGNVTLVGAKEDSSPWKVGIQHPRVSGALVGYLSLEDTSVVTSGDYERYFLDEKGKRWHHILDPRTGYPSNSGLTSVTVVSKDAVVCDAFSTALFVSGFASVTDMLGDMDNVGIVMVDEELRVFLTPNLQGLFHTRPGITVTVL